VLPGRKKEKKKKAVMSDNQVRCTLMCNLHMNAYMRYFAQLYLTINNVHDLLFTIMSDN